MTKEELEEKIKNNESVYDCLFLKEIKLNSNFIVTLETHSNQLYLLNKKEKQFYCPIDDIFSTKAQALHYLDNGNVTKIEKLPFYTFESVKKIEANLKANDVYKLIDNNKFTLAIKKGFVSQILLNTNNEKYNWNFTEEDFYDAYAFCKELFLGKENNNRAFLNELFVTREEAEKKVKRLKGDNR